MFYDDALTRESLPNAHRPEHTGLVNHIVNGARWVGRIALLITCLAVAGGIAVAIVVLGATGTGH